SFLDDQVGLCCGVGELSNPSTQGAELAAGGGLQHQADVVVHIDGGEYRVHEAEEDRGVVVAGALPQLSGESDRLHRLPGGELFRDEGENILVNRIIEIIGSQPCDDLRDDVFVD